MMKSNFTRATWPRKQIRTQKQGTFSLRPDRFSETCQVLTKRVLLQALTLLILTLALASCGREPDIWQTIQETGILRVGLDPTYPPFAVATENDLFGFDVDLARALADELGLQVQFGYFGYDGLYEALEAGQTDVLISALVIDETRTQDFAYSEPYFNAGQMLIVTNGSTIEEMADLQNSALAVELGSEGHVIAQEWTRRLAGLEVMPFNTPAEAVAAAANLTASATLLDHINARLLLAAQPTSLQLAPTPVTVEPYAFVVRLEDDQLLEHLNSSLARLISQGTLDTIAHRWLDG
jgi:ABC-type amino acid transport substrate-binding protein